jgi:hypothetical protein
MREGETPRVSGGGEIARLAGRGARRGPCSSERTPRTRATAVDHHFAPTLTTALDELQQRAAYVDDCSIRDGAVVSPAVGSGLLPDRGSHDDRAGSPTRAATNAGLDTVDDVRAASRQMRGRVPPL